MQNEIFFRFLLQNNINIGAYVSIKLSETFVTRTLLVGQNLLQAPQFS